MTEFSVNSGRVKDLIREPCVTLVNTEDNKWIQGEKVLSRWSDGLLYLGEILEVDNINERCLLRYEDLSVYWIMFKDIQKESFEHSDIICCVCNSGVSDVPNEIVICDNCGAGYHQNCHVPRVPATALRLEEEWNCRQCVFASTARKGGASNTGTTAKTMEDFKQILPYDLKSLTWDSQHKRNVQQTYCYCGGPGSWLTKMLQCYSCQQWFHEACIQCLEKPLFLGDRFYVFICSACTSGPEFIQRLNLTWPELVHLILFNLSTVEKKTYWDTEKIVNFIQVYWHDLQMNKDMKEPPSREEIRKNVTNSLENNRTKFKSGRETKKKACLWGLRCRTPPNSAPAFTCSKEQQLSKKLIQINKTLKCDGSTILSNNRRLRSKNSEIDNNNSYPLSSFPTPPPEESSSLSECSVKKLRHRLKSALETLPTKTKNRGAKRKRVPTRCLRSRKKPEVVSGISTSCDEDTSSRGTLNSIIPPPKNFDGHNNPFSNVLLYRNSTYRTNNDRRRGPGRCKTNKSVRAESRSLPQQAQNSVGSHQEGFVMEKSSFSLICDPFADCHQTMSAPRAFYPGFNQQVTHTSAAYSNLKTSVNNYFGAASRMANGEKFKVLASRVTNLSKVQYLIEWEGIHVVN